MLTTKLVYYARDFAFSQPGELTEKQAAARPGAPRWLSDSCALHQLAILAHYCSLRQLAPKSL